MTQDETPRALIGTSGWKKPQWRGHFYPPGLAQARELEYLASRLGSVEVNTAFHALQPASSYVAWHDGTPAGFTFAVKANRAAAHLHRLRSSESDIAEFFASGVLGLEQKLGPILWQLPGNLPFDPQTVETFLKVLPRSFDEARRLVKRSGSGEPDASRADGPILHCFEARHASFQTPEFYDLLRERGIAQVVTDSGSRELTADFVYIRLFSTPNLHPQGYDDESLDGWATTIEGWLTGRAAHDGVARSVYTYFASPGEQATRPPFDAVALQRRLHAEPVATRPADEQPALWN